MNTFTLGRRSRENLAGVHPQLVEVVELALAVTHVDFAVSEGVRGEARQRSLVRQGLSTTLASKHLLQSDGYGHAVDLVAVGDLDKNGIIDAQDQTHTWDHALYTEIASAMLLAASEIGVKVRWGGNFKRLFDGPHFELASKL